MGLAFCVGQSGAPSSDATSTNPTGTTQFDTGTDSKGETIGYGSADNVTNTSQYSPEDKDTATGYNGIDDTTSASQYPSGGKNTSASETLAAGLSTDGHGEHSPLESMFYQISVEQSLC